MADSGDNQDDEELYAAGPEEDPQAESASAAQPADPPMVADAQASSYGDGPTFADQDLYSAPGNNDAAQKDAPPAEGDQGKPGTGPGNDKNPTPTYGSKTTESSGGSTQSVAAPGSDAPDAPLYQAPDQTALKADRAKLATDTQGTVVKPKWTDRLLGGLVGFASRDAKLGSQVTHRGQIAADAASAKNVAADNVKVQGDQQDIADQEKLYQLQRDQFDDKTKAYTTKQEAAQRARENTRQDTNDQFEHSARNRQLDDEETGQKETARHNQAEEAATAAGQKQTANYEGSEISLKRRELDDQEARDDAQRPNSPASQIKRQQDANKLLQDRDKQVATIQNGDATKGVDSYAKKLADLQNSDTIPGTDEKWPDQKTKDTAIQQLKADHVAQLDQAEEEYAQSLNTLGFPAVPVRHDAEGRALNDSSGRALNPNTGQPYPTDTGVGLPPPQATQPVAGNPAPQPAAAQAGSNVGARLSAPVQQTAAPAGPVAPPQAAAPQPARPAPQPAPPSGAAVNPLTRQPYKPGDPVKMGGKQLYVRRVVNGQPVLTTNPQYVGK